MVAWAPPHPPLAPLYLKQAGSFSSNEAPGVQLLVRKPCLSPKVLHIGHRWQLSSESTNIAVTSKLDLRGPLLKLLSGFIRYGGILLQPHHLPVHIFKTLQTHIQISLWRLLHWWRHVLCPKLVKQLVWHHVLRAQFLEIIQILMYAGKYGSSGGV